MRGWENLGIGCLRHAQVFLGFLISRITPQRFIELDDGLGDVALGQIYSAQIVVGNCLLRVRPKCRQVISFRLLQISFRKKPIREAKLSVRIIRLEPENCPKLADVFIIFARCQKESRVSEMRIS